MEHNLYWNMRKELEQIEIKEDKCMSLRKQLEHMEIAFAEQNRQSKVINDDLFEKYGRDAGLENLLFQKEELLHQKQVKENQVLEDCKEELGRRLKNLEKDKMEIREKLQKGEDNENNHNT